MNRLSNGSVKQSFIYAIHRLGEESVNQLSHRSVLCRFYTSPVAGSVGGNTTMKHCLWERSPFNFIEAFPVGDSDHRDAFQAWVLDPWWP